MRCVMDSASLIYLTKSDNKEFVVDHVELIIPESVKIETTRHPSKYPDSREINKNVLQKKVKVYSVVKQRRTWQDSNKLRLGKGELDCLILAQQLATMVILDDVQAIRVAMSMGLTVLTTEMLLIRLHEVGVIRTKMELKARLQEILRLKPLRSDILMLMESLLSII